MSVRGQVVIVTGGALGIGRYVARTFAEAGAKVVIVDIAPTDSVAAELAGLEAESLMVRTDVTDEAQVRSMVDQVIQRFGRIDVLVNNAAIVTHFLWGNPAWPRIKNMDKAFFDKVMNTNLGGTFLCTKHVLPHMEAQRSGHVINLGQYGPAASGGLLGMCVYSVSKASIQAFSRNVAEEEREFNICVISMTPGATIAGEHAPEEARKRLAGPEVVGNSFVEAAEVAMELSGSQFTGGSGHLQLVP